VTKPPIKFETSSSEARRPSGLTDEALEDLIEQATVDAYDECEQISGFECMLSWKLSLPFQSEVLGVKVKVVKIEASADNQIVAVCVRGSFRQRIPLLDLPLPARTRPRGHEGRW
jgi:hypothetical protein